MRGLAAVVALTLVTIPGLVSAQTDIEVNAGIQFDFSTPGARTLALGGAFMGLADDASTAITNPGGLPTIGKAQIAIEARGWRRASIFTDRGRLNGTPSGIGVDTVRGLVDGKVQNDTTGVSFASIAVPKGPFGFAAYYTTTMKLKTDFKTFGAYTDVYRFFPTTNSLAFDIKSVGGAVAYHLRGGLSVGVGVTYHDFALSSLTQRYDFTASCFPCDQPGQSYGPPDYSPGNVNNTQTQEGTGKGWSFHFGVHSKLGKKLEIGYSFRLGAKFEFQAVNRGGAEFGDYDKIFATQRATFQIPDILAIGFAVHPNEATTLTVEFRRVRYSVLGARFVTVLTYPAPPPNTADFRASDANEAHAGFEYVLGREAKTPVALRIGAWYDPQHNMHYVGGPNVAAGFAAARFPKRKDRVHGTGGFGITLNERFQIDVAADLSSRFSTAAASGIVKF